MNVWLTRVILDPRNPAARRDLGNAELLHKRVMLLVPDGLGKNARATSGVLYRYDDTASAGPHLLVQSLLPTNPERLPEGYGAVAVREITSFLEKLESGAVVHYRITANTAKRLGRTADQAGKVVALHGSDAEEWWHTRAAANGLVLRTSVSTSMPDIRGRGKDAVRHAVTRFAGMAVVQDVEALRRAVVTGVGRGKAYGCGLLSLAPVNG
ncbi:type I-E CRISPR-associated protein Cas6/Cse3/CasE [Planomonospora venezuelensis]|uniref:CRISPR system Cascade subunit CasE n=1 Tax=Planomonospora venezuelensis TaxID=1999 RepID=A0A841DCS6_PLAVE|nr:type I-E CRISPR-associated protein Cas6/Cse3/CasE [Planomonospora venezuelensis]MBB5965915.1 CRISPR system Cascade subunit CasE [Planomonospora venezuelensis]GIM99000.1 type I-E CRISPR-associated protein Cas6/Cse3/CasE [Planomonospora venezuelensis]